MLVSGRENHAFEKPSSEGAEWVKRTQERRKEDETKELSEDTETKKQDYPVDWEIFGTNIVDVLKKKLIVDQRLTISGNLETQKLLRKETKEVYEKIRDIYDELKQAATKAPDKLENIFFNYLQKLPEIDSIAKKFQENNTNSSELEALLSNKENDRQTLIARKLSQLLVEKCANKDILDSTPILTPALELYMQQMLVKEKELQEKIPEFMQAFKRKIKKAVKQGLFPKSLLNVLEERLENLNFHIIDEITTKIHNRAGEFLEDRHAVRISTNEVTSKEFQSFFHKIFHNLSGGDPNDSRFAIFVHEAFHSISGQSEINDTESSETGTETKTDTSNETIDNKKANEEKYRITRSGLHIAKMTKKYNQNSSDKPTFVWLNEALTEQATRDIIDEKGGGAYQSERELLALMINNGIPRDLLYKAYFENYTVQEKGEHRTPELKKLFEFTNQKFGKKFLANLDRFISLNHKKDEKKTAGSAQAIEMWKKEGDNFPQYLENWVKERRKEK
jgi:hypothetical protein